MLPSSPAVASSLLWVQLAVSPAPPSVTEPSAPKIGTAIVRRTHTHQRRSPVLSYAAATTEAR